MLDKEGVCVGVLIPFFDVRKESYYWPWDESLVNKYKTQALELEKIIGDKYECTLLDYFLYVDFTSNSNKYSLIEDENMKEKITDKSSLYGTYWHLSTEGDDFVKESLI